MSQVLCHGAMQHELWPIPRHPPGRREENLENLPRPLQEQIQRLSGTIQPQQSPFRKTNTIETILHRHEDWPIIKSILEQGCDYPFKDGAFTSEQLSKELEIMLTHGNHKSATIPQHHKIVKETYSAETTKGWQIPVSFETLKKLKDVMVIPLGLQIQMAVNEKGEYAEKNRVTHDCSFQCSGGFSLNSSVDSDKIPACRFGMYLRRFLHQIQHARLKHPKENIYIIKTDLDAAYCRINVHPHIALKQVSIVDSIAFIGLRLPFGSMPAPSLFCTISDAVFDLALDLVEDETWQVDSIHSPNQHKLPDNTNMNESIPFVKAKPLLVKVPDRDCFIDGYIDDGITGCVDINDNMKKLQNCVPLAIHLLFRPLGHEEVDRKDPLSDKKLQGEGPPSEEKCVLGWDINTRLFIIKLPVHKFIAWSGDLSKIIGTKMTTFDIIKKVLGRLTHVVYIFFPGRSFLNRIRGLDQRCEKYGRQNLASEELADFKVWVEFLGRLTKFSTSINNVTTTEIDITCWSDACETELGGYTSSGQAFSFKIPPHSQGIFHINLLEFLAAKHTISLALKHSQGQNIKIA